MKETDRPLAPHEITHLERVIHRINAGVMTPEQIKRELNDDDFRAYYEARKNVAL